jgi:hypothetical protein
MNITSPCAMKRLTDATRRKAPQKRMDRYADSVRAKTAASETSRPSQPGSWLDSHALMTGKDDDDAEGDHGAAQGQQARQEPVGHPVKMASGMSAETT